MATSLTHTRSISLPSRLIHPTNFESKLQKIKSLQIISAFPSSEIQSSLVGLAELYNSVQFSPVSQDAKSSIEESLSGSVQLLDFCSAIRELIQMMKENVHALQSALRRKGLECSSVQNDVVSYFSCRKRMNKLIAKSLKKLKGLENPRTNGELTGVTVAVFKSVLAFLSGPAPPPLMAASRWSLVSKMMAGKSAGENDGDVEFALRCLHGKMRSGNGGVTAVDVQLVLKKLQNVDAVIEEFDGGLERLFRQLIQNRVALLNIVADH